MLFLVSGKRTLLNLIFPISLELQQDFLLQNDRSMYNLRRQCIFILERAKWEKIHCVLFKEKLVSEVALVFFINLTESGSKSTLFEDSTSNIKKNPKQQQHNNKKKRNSLFSFTLKLCCYIIRVAVAFLLVFPYWWFLFSEKFALLKSWPVPDAFWTKIIGKNCLVVLILLNYYSVFVGEYCVDCCSKYQVLYSY